MTTKEPEVWSIDTDGACRYRGRLCVPNKSRLKMDILDEAHKSQMTLHIGGTKIYKDLERLVGRNEARDCNICITMSYLSESQDRTSETTWIITTVTCSSMEMETYIYGFHGWIAKISTKSRCNMGYYRSTYQDGAFCCV